VRHFFLKKKIMHIFCHQNALKARYEQSIDNIQTNCNYKYHLCMDRIYYLSLFLLNSFFSWLFFWFKI
jgi:hypothetical protein